jgi:hypothetical protein
VRDELTKLGLHCTSVELGRSGNSRKNFDEQHDLFRVALLKSGLELMDDKKSVLIQKIKNVIIELVHLFGGATGSQFFRLLKSKAKSRLYLPGQPLL